MIIRINKIQILDILFFSTFTIIGIKNRLAQEKFNKNLDIISGILTKSQGSQLRLHRYSSKIMGKTFSYIAVLKV